MKRTLMIAVITFVGSCAENGIQRTDRRKAKESIEPAGLDATTVVIDNTDDAKSAAPAPVAAKPEVNSGEKPAPGKGLSLAENAHGILEAKCSPCHSIANAQGGFGTIMDTKAMIESGRLLVPGKPDDSVIFKRLVPQSNMPPDRPFTEDEKKVLSDWIISLKEEKVEKLVPLTDAEQYSAIRKDLEANVPAADQPTTRYFTLQAVQNRGGGKDQLETNRQAFIKAVNSLSENPVILIPKAIDKNNLIYRVNLNDMNMPAARFSEVMRDFYPYNTRLLTTTTVASAQAMAADYAAAAAATQTAFFVIRLDWFNSTALLPAIYATFMRLDSNGIGTVSVQNLENRLGVNSEANLLNNAVLRSGFKNSGVSSNNRIVERHAGTGGRYYWLSYDFFDSLDNQNVFQNPLGPRGIGFDNRAFQHDGGEAIFELPNGFMGFFLETSAGNLIEKGPQGIVRNAEGPPEFVGAIINGISCFSCHAKGMLDKQDQIRNFVAANATFDAAEIDKINSLYAQPSVFTKAIETDSLRYIEAQKKAGIDVTKPEPVTPSFRYFYQKLSRSTVIAELGITEAQLDTLLARRPFQEDWASLRLKDGFLTRREFNQNFGRALEEFNSGFMEYLGPNVGDFILTPTCMNADAVLTTPCIDASIQQTNNLN